MAKPLGTRIAATPPAPTATETETEAEPQNTDQVEDTNTNPLNPAGDSLDRLIQMRLNEDIWQGLLGELPCLDAQTACIQQLQEMAIANSKSLQAIDERVELVNQKIEEARRNNQATIKLGVFEPLVQSWLRVDTITETKNGQTTTKKRGFFDRVGDLFLGGSQLLSGLNDILSLIGVPLFRNATGGDTAAQQRAIAITDLQVKVAEIQKQRSDLADKIKEAVLMQVLEFDVARKDFQVSQEIARRDLIRAKLRQIDYRYSTKLSTDAYLASLSSLDRTKADSYRQWSRVRSHLAKIKLLVLGSD